MYTNIRGAEGVKFWKGGMSWSLTKTSEAPVHVDGQNFQENHRNNGIWLPNQ